MKMKKMMKIIIVMIYQNKDVKKRVGGVQNKMNNQIQNKHQITIMMMMTMMIMMTIILLIIVVVDIENEIIDHQDNMMTIDIIVVDVQKSM
jgi:flagellar biosynthesis protein FlhB